MAMQHRVTVRDVRMVLFDIQIAFLVSLLLDFQIVQVEVLVALLGLHTGLMLALDCLLHLFEDVGAADGVSFALCLLLLFEGGVGKFDVSGDHESVHLFFLNASGGGIVTFLGVVLGELFALLEAHETVLSSLHIFGGASGTNLLLLFYQSFLGIHPLTFALTNLRLKAFAHF